MLCVDRSEAFSTGHRACKDLCVSHRQFINAHFKAGESFFCGEVVAEGHALLRVFRDVISWHMERES
jgi:hypothetical protein